MKNAPMNHDNKTDTSETMKQSRYVESKNESIEEKRLKLALALRTL